MAIRTHFCTVSDDADRAYGQLTYDFSLQLQSRRDVAAKGAAAENASKWIPSSHGLSIAHEALKMIGGNV